MKIKIATIDIETYPAEVLMYGHTYEPVIVKIKHFESILSCSIKINGNKTVFYGLNTIKGYKKGNKDDRKLMIEITKVLNEVDYICGQNSDDFDIKKIKERFIFHRLPALNEVPTLDIKKLYKQVSKLPNNKLNTISQFNGIGEKEKHSGTSLYINCGDIGDEKDWKILEKYNKKDVDLTWEDLKIVLPYVKLPASYSRQQNNGINCPNPLCINIMTKSGTKRVITGLKQQWHCEKCGRYYTPNKIIK